MKASTERQGPIPLRAGFTLIELMVVIAIIGVLFAVAMPLFESMGKKDADRAAFQYMTTLRLARQHAVNKRQWTLVVHPTMAGGPYEPEDLDKCLRGYAVLGVISRVDHLSTAERRPDNFQFEFISDWRYLPEGIYFDDRNKDLIGGSDNAIFERLFTTAYEYPLRPGSDAIKRPMAVMMFVPDGQMYSLTPVRFAKGQDVIVHLTSSRYYERLEDRLAPPVDIPGTNIMVHITSKSGQPAIRRSN